MTHEERQALARFCDAAETLGDAARSLRRVLEGDDIAGRMAEAVEEAPDVEDLPPIDVSSIRALVAAIFTVGELVRFANQHTRSVTARVNWSGSKSAVAFDFVSALDRAGRLDSAFFKALRDARPRRAEQIRQVQLDFGRGVRAIA